MADLSIHPTVLAFNAAAGTTRPPTPQVLNADWLRTLCLDYGADDVGFVEIDRPELGEEHKTDILKLFPHTKTMISIVCRMNRENIRAPTRSVANLEFHHVGDKTDEVVRLVVSGLEAVGVRAMNGGAVGFPMEVDRTGTEKVWLVSHKSVAEAAGLGRMGIHRNVIHPKFGNFILLGTVLVDAKVSAYSESLDYNPCLECKLCVAACPTGAIAADGHFDFTACYTHNYREFLGGFGDWVETVADSPNAKAYKARMSAAETSSVWQSLSFGANYKAANCMSVCPAGGDVIGPYLTDRKRFIEETVQPFTEKPETIYVVAGSDAETYVSRRFPHKRIKRVHNGLSQMLSIRVFLRGLPVAFQRGRSAGLGATYHFTFTGREQAKVTIQIRNKAIKVTDGHQGPANFVLTADSETWLGFVRKEVKLPWALIRRKIRFRGSPRLLLAFSRCFPS
jgi:ferredoxin